MVHNDDVARLSRRLEKDRTLAGAYAGAARLVLESDDAESTVERFADLFDVPNSVFFQALDSVAYRPAGGRGSRTVVNRLVIVDSAADEEALALLLPGAEATTVIVMSDTFGKADLEKYRAWPDVGTLRIEHIRTRITRFSQEYIDLHEATAVLATSVSNRVGSIAGAVGGRLAVPVHRNR